MKINRKLIASCLSLGVAGLFVVSAAQAATIPTKITGFTADVTNKVLSARGKGWRDPAFGNMGWTHSSAWGTFKARKGDIVTIKIVVADPGIHPGITVWSRTKADTARNKYVVDHFYPQNANFTKFGATDDTTGEQIGNIVMTHVYHAYDQDGSTKRVKAVLEMNPKKDKVPGQLEVKFVAPTSSVYQFVTGGVSPDDGVDNAVHDFNATITVTPRLN